MKKKLFLLLSIVSLSFVASAIAAPPLGYGMVIENLDLRKNTKLHVKEYWKSIADQEITWSGEMYDVKGGRSHVKIYVADKSHPLFKGYNIVVTSSDVAKASDMKRGDKIRFKGILHNYSANRSGAVIEIRNAQLL